MPSPHTPGRGTSGEVFCCRSSLSGSTPGAAGPGSSHPASPGSRLTLPHVPGNGAVLETRFWAPCSRQCLLGYKPQVNHVLYKMKHFDPRLEGCHLHFLPTVSQPVQYIYFMTPKQGKDVASQLLHLYEFCSFACVSYTYSVPVARNSYRVPVLAAAPLGDSGLSCHEGCRSHPCCRRLGAGKVWLLSYS